MTTQPTQPRANAKPQPDNIVPMPVSGDEYIEPDLSGTARIHAEQLARWLENGWINLNNAKTVAALFKLRALLNNKT
jgi:hypothetical protein